jgi:hypothetical protein
VSTGRDGMPGVSQHPATEDDANRWREAAQLRSDHPGWVIIWFAPDRQFRAYPLSQRRGATALTAATAAELAEQISRAR